eukprot:2792384-Pyramimonas_sp.AAC.1
MVGGRARGRCLTTTLACDPAVPDPALETPLQVVREWVALRLRHPDLHDRVIRAWPLIRKRLQKAATRRWAYARGPIATVQATLMDTGWDPVAATSWLRPTECDSEPVDQWGTPSRHDTGFSALASFEALFEDLAADIRGI